MLLCKTSSSIVSVFALLSIAFTIGAAAPAPTLARPPIVKTNSGDIQGSVATSFLDRRTYYSFRGIPFAQPPIGHLRFKVSVPCAVCREKSSNEEKKNVQKFCLGISRSGTAKN